MKETCDSGAHIVALEPSRPAMAIVTSPDSDVDHPAQLADLPIAVNFHAGSHFACIRMLEGFLGQKHLNMLDYGHPEFRFEAMMRGEVAAAVIMEPFITLAEKVGCNILTEAFFTSTDVARDDMDKDTLTALFKALGKAVDYLNQNPQHKRQYVHYLLEDIPDDFPWGKPTIDDFRLSRLRFKPPTPYTEKEFNLTADLMIRWNLLSPDATYQKMVNQIGQKE